MIRRLLAVGLTAAALVSVPAAAPASAARDCGGVLDYDCWGVVCSLDCFYIYCTVWVDPLHNPHSALCIL